MATLIREIALPVQGGCREPAAIRGAATSILVSSGRDILRLAADARRPETVVSGFQLPAGVAVLPDGGGLAVADLDIRARRWTLRILPAGANDAATARTLAQGAGLPGQLACTRDAIFLVDRMAGDLLRIDLASGTTRRLLAGLAAPVGVALAASGRLLVTESRAGRIMSVAPDGSGAQVELTGLRNPQYVTSDAAQLLVAEDLPPATIRIWGGAGLRSATLLSLGATDRALAAWRLGDKVVVIDGHGLRWWDPKGVPTLPVRLSMADQRPFIGSFQRVTVDMGTTGKTIEELSFRFSEGDAAGQISPSRDDLSLPNELMLLVGYKPGKHVVEAVDRMSQAVLGSATFETVDTWSDADRGPPRWCGGELKGFQTGYTWGGGPGVPQNVDVMPQLGARTLCILTVDVADARYPTGAAFDTIREAWRTGAVGTTPDPDGKVRSSKAYYEEVSYGAFTLSLAGGKVLSISLDGKWADYFKTMPSPWPANSFQPINGGAFAQACVSAAAALTDGNGAPLVDFAQVQTLIMVVRSKGAATTDDFFWPQAWGGAFVIPGGSATFAVLGMPEDWNPTRDTRTIFETLSHEIGHNLGYPDLYTNANTLYTPQVQARDITDFDLMSAEQELPHMTVAQKLEVGWVRPGWVMPLDFSRSTNPFDQTFTLQAIETGAPPAGRFAALEVRISDGWNYYFEYRRSQPPQIGDQQLAGGGDTGDAVVLGTDAISQSFTFPVARPQIMRLRRDAENENSFFVAGQDYKETDSSSGMAIADFRMSVLSITGNSASIRVQYGVNGRPDLYIRPWPGGDIWQSPDIEVRNAKAQANPAEWTNVPWVKHQNTIVARYRNRGTVTARNVTVDFFIKDFTVGGAPEVQIGSDTRDVPPESTTPFVEFTCPWIPTNDGHKCVVVRTPLYIDTSVNPNIVELSDANNSAQSNYTRYVAENASPSRRGVVDITLNNPFDKRAEIYLAPQIRGTFAGFYRLYLEAISLKLDPGESRKVRVLVESRYGDPLLSGPLERLGRKFFAEDTRMSLIGYGLPADAPSHPQLLGGATISVGTGRASRFVEWAYLAERKAIIGRVATSTGSAVDGTVLLTFGGGPGPERSIPVEVGAGGNFVQTEVPALLARFRAKTIAGHYVGRMGFAPCDAPTVLTP